MTLPFVMRYLLSSRFIVKQCLFTDGEDYIIELLLFYWLKYELVISHHLSSITNFKISFQQQSASRNEQQVNFLFWILPLACFWIIRTIKRIRNTVVIIWQAGLGVRLSKEIKYWYHHAISVWNKQIFYGVIIKYKQTISGVIWITFIFI